MHTPRRYSNSAESREKTDTYRKGGLNCRIGDIMWIENYTAKEGVKIASSSSRRHAYAFIAKESHKGLAGCVSAISNREYDFYRVQEIQQREDRRANGQAIKNAANAWADAHTPPAKVNVNVHHSGTIRYK